MDEFDIEVAPLEGSHADESANTSPHSRSPLSSRIDSRGRLLRVGSVLAALVVVAAVLVAVTPWTRTEVISFIQGPTPTATPPIDEGRDHVAVEHQLPWGLLTIDGHPGPHLSLTSSELSAGVQLVTFGLARGHHRLEYRAEPFPTLRCTLSVPGAPSDTCPLDPQVIDYLVPTGRFTRLLDLLGTPDRLPALAQTQLADATQSALERAAVGAKGTLAQGDHYLDADARVITASEALTADATYQLDREVYPISGRYCATLCVERSPTAQTSASEWLLYATASLSWSYRDISGHVILANGPPGPSLGVQQGAEIQVGVRLVDSAWQVRLLPLYRQAVSVRDPLTCPTGANYLDILRYTHGQSTVDPADITYQWPLSSMPSELGCVFGGGRYFDAQGNLTGPVALVLYRYGTLLAVNDEAHAVFPHIPWANVHERAFALASWPPGPDAVGPGA